MSATVYQHPSSPVSFDPPPVTPASIAQARQAQLQERTAVLLALPVPQRRKLIDAFLSESPDAAREGASR